MEFLPKGQSQSCSEPIRSASSHFLVDLGCRGVKEIDMAAPRTREDEGVLFRRLKLINIDHN